MKNQWLMINQLDHQLKDWQAVSKKYGSRPKTGWIKTIRNALSMSSEQLANRIGLSRKRIVQLEHAETNDAVTLRTLKDAADALGCELVYAVVPKGNNTLEDIIRERAHQIATERVTRVAHTMALEDQSVNKNAQQIRINEQTKMLMDNLNKKFWVTAFTSRNKTSKK